MSPTEFVTFFFLLLWFGVKAVFKIVSLMSDLTDWRGSFERLLRRFP